MHNNGILYTRVSTDEQKEHGFSLQDQETRLRKYSKRENIDIVAHYQDDHSAKDFNRPEFQKMLSDLRQKKLRANLLLCVRMDRFSRNATDTLNMIQELKSFGISLKLIEGEYDLSVPENLIPYMLNVVLPQVENERRGLNTKRGMRQANREGRYTGKAPKGYKNIREDGKGLIVQDHNADFVREAFEVFSTGLYSRDQVLHMLRKKGFKCSKNQFGLLLRNPAYIGKVTIKAWKDEPEEIVDGLHEPLVSEELFNRVQLILDKRQGTKKKWNCLDPRFPLRGHLTCRVCGGYLTASASKGRKGEMYPYYHCQKGCKERFRADVANDIFIDYLAGFQIPSEVVTLYYKVMEDIFKRDDAKRDIEIVGINKEISRLEQAKENAEDKLLGEEIDSITFHRIQKRYSTKIDKLKQRKDDLESADTNFMQYVRYGFSLIKDLSHYYVTATVQVKHNIIGSIFPDKLTYDDKKYRTTKMNQILELLTSNINKLGKMKKEKAAISSSLSYNAPAVGLEPTT